LRGNGQFAGYGDGGGRGAARGWWKVGPSEEEEEILFCLTNKDNKTVNN